MEAKHNSAVAPGVTLDQFIRSKPYTRKTFATFMRVDVRRLNDLISGALRINAQYAIALERAAGDPLRDARYWMGLQNDYDICRAKQSKEVAA